MLHLITRNSDVVGFTVAEYLPLDEHRLNKTLSEINIFTGCKFCFVISKFSDPLLTQNPKKAGRAGRKQRKSRRANGGKKHKSEPK